MSLSRRHVLLLEDSCEVQAAFTACLEDQHNFVVHSVNGPDQLLGEVSRENFDLAIVDLGPGGFQTNDRLEAIKEVRKLHHFPIIAMTAHEYPGLLQSAFDAQVDDFLRKPLNFVEVMCRLNRHLERSLTNGASVPSVAGIRLPDTSFEFAGATVNPDMTLSFSNGHREQLNAKHFGILQVFSENPGGLVLRDQLVRAVWGADANTNSKSVTQYLYTLRKMYKIGGIDLGDFLTNVVGAGWRVVANAHAQIN